MKWLVDFVWFENVGIYNSMWIWNGGTWLVAPKKMVTQMEG